MSTVFQQTKAYRDYSLFDITRLTEQEAWELFRTFRWGPGKEVVCPNCTNRDEHSYIKTRRQWTCKNCGHRFSVTSSTPFSNRKLPFGKILTLIYLFVTSAQGSPANAHHAIMNNTLKTLFHNYGKIREAIFQKMDLTPLEGLIHIDCAYFCGKPRRANKRKHTDSGAVNSLLRGRKDAIWPDSSTHPEPKNVEKKKNQRVLLAMSQVAPGYPDPKGSDRTITIVLKKENPRTILPLIKKYVSKNAYIMTDCGSAFQPIFRELGIGHSKVNHSVEYQDANGVNNNMAESFFSRVRRSEFGTYNGMRNQYFAFYAAEFAWRNDSSNMSIRTKFEDLMGRIFACEPSKAFCNYNHGHRLEFEYVM